MKKVAWRGYASAWYNFGMAKHRMHTGCQPG